MKNIKATDNVIIEDLKKWNGRLVQDGMTYSDLMKYRKVLDWSKMSLIINLTEEIIKEFNRELKVHAIIKNSTINSELIKLYLKERDYIEPDDFRLIARAFHLPESILEDFIIYHNNFRRVISRYQPMSLEFMKKYINAIDMAGLYMNKYIPIQDKIEIIMLEESLRDKETEREPNINKGKENREVIYNRIPVKEFTMEELDKIREGRNPNWDKDIPILIPQEQIQKILSDKCRQTTETPMAGDFNGEVLNVYAITNNKLPKHDGKGNYRKKK